MYIDTSINNGKAAAKRNNLYNNISNFLNEKKLNENMITAIHETQDKVKLEEINSIAAYKKNKKNKLEALSESTEFMLEGVHTVFGSFLTECVYDMVSTHIPEVLLKENREEIIKKVNEFYTEVSSELNFSNNIITEAYNNILFSINESLDGIETFNLLKPQSDYIKEHVGLKVDKVLEEERLISDLAVKKENGMLTNNIKLTNKTMYKTMYVENVKEAIKGYEDVPDITKQDIMESAYYETLIEYTMLEMFNTMELVEFRNESTKDIFGNIKNGYRFQL